MVTTDFHVHCLSSLIVYCYHRSIESMLPYLLLHIVGIAVAAANCLWHPEGNTSFSEIISILLAKDLLPWTSGWLLGQSTTPKSAVQQLISSSNTWTTSINWCPWSVGNILLIQFTLPFFCPLWIMPFLLHIICHIINLLQSDCIDCACKGSSALDKWSLAGLKYYT